MTAFSPTLAADDDLLLTDFTASSADLGWYVVNDNVMGGRSEGGFDMEDTTLVFTGRTNTRGGGVRGHQQVRLRRRHGHGRGRQRDDCDAGAALGRVRGRLAFGEERVERGGVF